MHRACNTDMNANINLTKLKFVLQPKANCVKSIESTPCWWFGRNTGHFHFKQKRMKFHFNNTFHFWIAVSFTTNSRKPTSLDATTKCCNLNVTQINSIYINLTAHWTHTVAQAILTDCCLTKCILQQNTRCNQIWKGFLCFFRLTEPKNARTFISISIWIHNLV